MDRRQFITGVATVSAVALAGCGDSEGGGRELSDRTAEDAVEQYYTAANDDDVESANEVIHPESEAHPIEEADLEDFDATLIEVNQLSTREFVEWEQGGELSEEEIEQEVERQEEVLNDVIEFFDADDAALVLVTEEVDGEEIETTVRTVQDDGDWYLYN
ncbi:hypothetical protein [Halorubrum tibetense]|uniref:Uncharacterized protein n=1 Tax=Halorubrum tibetense TaxID=175631 RepID=A0ABD5SDK8_9EURY